MLPARRTVARSASFTRDLLAMRGVAGSVRTVARRRDDALTALVRDAAASAGQRGVFNPTFAHAGETIVVAYRAIPPGERGIRAYLATSTGSAPVVTDLTALGDAAGIARVADPKLVTLGGSVYAAFNTGYVPHWQQNDIHLVRVHPDIGPIQRVAARFDRQAVEKNWAFFEAPGGVRAVYRLHPYAEVELVAGALGEGGDLTFDLRMPTAADSGAADGLSIGTPLATASAASTRLLIAHEKVVRPTTIDGERQERRAYFGRAVAVAGAGTDDVRVRVGRQRLIHSVPAALPREGVHNPNLMSATYFSGLEVDGDDAVLGYGINDTGFGVARVTGASLWP